MDSASLSWICTLVLFECHFFLKIVFEHTLITLYYLYRYYILDTAQLQVLKLCYKVKKYCQVLKSRKINYQVRRCFADAAQVTGIRTQAKAVTDKKVEGFFQLIPGETTMEHVKLLIGQLNYIYPLTSVS